jgi:hypothetical protein
VVLLWRRQTSHQSYCLHAWQLPISPTALPDCAQCAAVHSVLLLVLAPSTRHLNKDWLFCSWPPGFILQGWGPGWPLCWGPGRPPVVAAATRLLLPSPGGCSCCCLGGFCLCFWFWLSFGDLQPLTMSSTADVYPIGCHCSTSSCTNLSSGI